MAEQVGASDGATILLIESHGLLRAATALGLQRQGFIVHSAAGVTDGLRLLHANPAIAVALLEIELGAPGPNGFAFVAAAALSRRDLGIVLLTGRADMLVGRKASLREVHLVKPCPLPRVVAAIRGLLPAADNGLDQPDAAQ